MRKANYSAPIFRYAYYIFIYAFWGPARSSYVIFHLRIHRHASTIRAVAGSAQLNDVQCDRP
ncbi:hypothetical protein BDW42DRAFT_175149 [Aspergillus taichungensis]|uniref:Uncharacterized protein n=1 Tax=Aspergillus taichungensis TaxID=482145 RepID=A0A2J5HM55_9EURO|nr:hypothetical protein BDW42DRAFT_175149 [Aspergillus taichungensis]